MNRGRLVKNPDPALCRDGIPVSGDDAKERK
jgi:hypothetical protein